MNVDPTVAVVAVGALVVISSLVGMFVGAFWGLRRIVADVIRMELGWLAEWRKSVDEDRAKSKKDESGIFTRLRLLEAGVARLEAHR